MWQPAIVPEPGTEPEWSEPWAEAVGHDGGYLAQQFGPQRRDRDTTAPILSRSDTVWPTLSDALNTGPTPTPANDESIQLAASYFELFGELNMTIHTMERMNQRGISPSQLSRALNSPHCLAPHQGQ